MKTDFLIGPAGQIESVLTLMADDLMLEGGNLKLLLYGAPGVGKTELVNRLALHLTKDCPLGIESYNGKEVDVAIVKRWREQVRYGSIFSEWSVLIINEVDRASNDAQVLMLTLLDELPPRRAILCTSNLNVGALSDRFQTRFTQYKVSNPVSEDIELLVAMKYPGLHDQEYQCIALGSGGNVRAAIADAKAAFYAMKARKAQKAPAVASDSDEEELWN